jgi:hypothetical protein
MRKIPFFFAASCAAAWRVPSLVDRAAASAPAISVSLHSGPAGEVPAASLSGRESERGNAAAETRDVDDENNNDDDSNDDDAGDFVARALAANPRFVPPPGDADPAQGAVHFAPRRNLSADFEMADHVDPAQRARLFDVCAVGGVDGEAPVQVPLAGLTTVEECRAALRRFLDEMFASSAVRWRDAALAGITADVAAVTAGAPRRLSAADELLVWKLVVHTVSHGRDTQLFRAIRPLLPRAGYRLPFLLSRVQSYLHRPYDFDTHARGSSGILTGAYARAKVDAIARSLDETGSFVFPDPLPPDVVDAILETAFRACPFSPQQRSYDAGRPPIGVQESGYSPACHRKMLEHETLARLGVDPNVIAALQDYFGAHPLLCQVNAFWSGHSRRRTSQNQILHQDADFMQFTKLFVYLTDTNDTSAGPHTFMPRSLRFTHDLVPGYEMGDRFTDAEATARLGAKHGLEIRPVTGVRGTAVLVDTHNLHRGSNPAPGGHRLVLIYEWAGGSWYTGQITPERDVYPRPDKTYKPTEAWRQFASRFPRVLDFACNLRG